MIERISGEYIPTCDICGDQAGTYETWKEALAAIKQDGWSNHLCNDGHYEHVCRYCMKQAAGYKRAGAR